MFWSGSFSFCLSKRGSRVVGWRCRYPLGSRAVQKSLTTWILWIKPSGICGEVQIQLKWFYSSGLKTKTSVSVAMGDVKNSHQGLQPGREQAFPALTHKCRQGSSVISQDVSHVQADSQPSDRQDLGKFLGDGSRSAEVHVNISRTSEDVCAVNCDC